MIKISETTIKNLRAFIEPEMINEAAPLEIVDYESTENLIIIEENKDGNIDLIDGYHRVAGLLAAGVKDDEPIEVIASDNADLNQYAADKESGELHSSAIEMIQRIAQRRTK